MTPGATMPSEIDLLKTITERGFDDMQRRMDEQREINLERHRDNVGRLEKIETAVSGMAKTTEAHDQQIKTLFARGVPVTLVGLKWYLACFGAGLLALYWLHEMGVVK